MRYVIGIAAALALFNLIDRLEWAFAAWHSKKELQREQMRRPL